MIEIRVHGIGDHKPLDALGVGLADVEAGERDPVVEYAVPPLPAHELRLINWSRTSRRVAGFLWYLAIPFTLVNVAGEMTPFDRRTRRAFPVVVYASGLVLTVAATLWLLVILETVVKRLPWVTRARDIEDVLLVVVGLILVGLARRIWRSDSATAWKALGSVHIALVALITGVLLWWRPASHEVSWWWTWLPDACTPDPDGTCGTQGALPASPDISMTVVAATSLVMVVLAIAAWVLARGRPANAGSVRKTGSGPGAALSLLLALALVHGVGALLRNGLDWLLLYPMRYAAVNGGWCSELVPPAPCRSAGLPARERVVLVFDDSRAPVYLLDTVGPQAVLWFLTILLGLVAAVALRWSHMSLPSFRAVVTNPTNRAEFSHRLVQDLPQVLARALPIGGLLFLGSSLLLLNFVLGPDDFDGWGYAFVVSASHIGAALVVVFVLLGARGSPRQVLAAIADVLGFWPVRVHPFAGRSYRKEVIEGIEAAVTRTSPDRVVLVGHSQGSVLAAWAASSSSAAPRMALVTCGSPLASLYGTFFPRTFDDEFFARTSSLLDDRWNNFWRDTDPIATALPIGEEPDERVGSESARNIQLMEPDPVRPLGHSGYWTEVELMSAVATLGSG